MRKALILAMALAVGSTAATAVEQTGTEMLFDVSTLDGVEAGDALIYSYTRSADENIPVKPIENGSIIVDLVEADGKSRTEVTLKQGGMQRKLQHFPADRGNPIFVTFLESSVASVTFATKGSPFYVRNRIKDAFASGGDVTEVEVEYDGKSVPATRIDFAPFKGDRNRKKLGEAFENLSINFIMSDAVPGTFVSMTAEANMAGVEYFIERIEFADTQKTEP